MSRAPKARQARDPDTIDAAAFEAWLAPHLERYRWIDGRAKGSPSRQDEADRLVAIAKVLQAAMLELAEGGIGLGPWAHVTLDEIAREAGRPRWKDQANATAAAVSVLFADLHRARRRVLNTPVMRGPRAQPHRDELQACIVEHLRTLGLRPKAARKMTAHILLSHGILTAWDERTARRVEGRAKGGGNGPRRRSNSAPIQPPHRPVTLPVMTQRSARGARRRTGNHA